MTQPNLGEQRESHVRFHASGERMAELVRARDWSTSTLGAYDVWPDALRAALSTVLASPTPMFVAWGPALALLHNDEGARMLASRHPAALGMPLPEAWPHVWSSLAPHVQRALEGESSVTPGMRYGSEQEDVWCTFSVSPLLDGAGKVGGVLCVGAAANAREAELLAAQGRHEFLAATARTLRANHAPEAAMHDAARALGPRLGAHRVGFIDVRDESTLVLGPSWVDGTLEGTTGELQAHTLGAAVLETLRKGDVVTWEDAAADPRAQQAIFPQVGTRAALGVPIVRLGRWKACLYVSSATPRTWSAHDVALAREVAELTWDIVVSTRASSVLAAEVDARTEKLREAEEQLRQAQKMEAVGQLTGGIAHDFNNMLQGITGALHLIEARLAEGRPGEIAHFVDVAMRGAKRAAAVTHRLLAFSRRQPLAPEPVNANRLVRSMRELIQRSVGDAIAVELVLAADVWGTKCDASQLENSILNLAINARDAMSAGGTLRVETTNSRLGKDAARENPELVAGEYVRIAVTDTGEGMTPDVISRAFDPFFTTKPIGQGTGLGLSMVYGFARQSGGHVLIDSELGKGTSVTIMLPRHTDEAAAAEASAPQLASEAKKRAAGAGEVIVLVEDDDDVREILLEVLEELGYTILDASTGPEALERMKEAPRVDLLVTDVGLPGLNGRQVADAARVARPDLKVLFLTGYAESAARASGLLEPGMQMLTKPVDLNTFVARIRAILDEG